MTTPDVPAGARKRTPRSRKAAHAKQGEREAIPKVTRRATRWFLGSGLAVALLVTVALVYLLVHQHRTQAAQAAALKQQLEKGPKVLVRRLFKAPTVRIVTLPAIARAYSATTLYGKTAGYVKEMRTDKGLPVKKGEVLAIIESPETDQQVDAAKANLFLQGRMAKRANFLAPSGVVSMQDKDTADANLRSAHANLAQSLALQKYEVVEAPFDGICTARYVDPGALIPAATGSTQAALPVVDVADPNHIRVQVFVGQDIAPFVAVGDTAFIWQDQRPDRLIAAQVALASGAIDETSRTELVELQFDNRDVGMLPGTFVHVQLKVRSRGLAVAPVEALVVREGKLFLGVVGAGGNGGDEGDGEQVKLVQIQIGNNDGQQMEVLSGVQGNEEVALNLPAGLVDGDKIQPVRPKQKEPGDGGEEPSSEAKREPRLEGETAARAMADEAPPNEASAQPSAREQREHPQTAGEQTGRDQGPRDQPGIEPPPAVATQR